MKLILTNPNEPKFPLGVLDLSTGDLVPVDIPIEGSGRGIAKIPNGYALLVNQVSEPATLCLLNDSLVVEHVHQLPDTSDPHDLKYFDGKLLLCSTGNDRIFEYDLTTKEMKLLVGSMDEEEDTLHRNCLVRWKSNWWYSEFGPKPEGGWRFAHWGRVRPINPVNLAVKGKAKDTVALNMVPINQPHSLIVVDDFMVALESKAGNLVDPLTAYVFCSLPGYIRGTAFDATSRLLYVGNSTKRLISKHTGEPHEDDKSDITFECGVFIVDTVTWRVRGFCSIESEVFQEIFAIAIME